MFVALSQSGALLLSNDATNWTRSTLGGDSGAPGNSIQAITYGNDKFVAVGGYGKVYVSTNAIQWTSKTLPGSPGLSGIAFGNDVFVALDFLNSTAWTSPDGVTWTKQAPLPAQANSIISFAGGHFFIRRTGHTETIFSSIDCMNWEAAPGGGYVTARRDQFGTTEFVGLASDTVTVSREDTVSSRFPLKTPFYLVTGLANGNGRYVAVGSSNSGRSLALVSLDGIEWAAVGETSADFSIKASPLRDIIFAANRFWAVGGIRTKTEFYAPLAILTSTNGITWSAVDSAIRERVPFSGIAFGNGRFVGIAHSDDPFVSSSFPASNCWVTVFDSVTSLAGQVNSPLSKVTFGQEKFVAVGGRGTIATSVDGFIWFLADSRVTNQLNAVALGGNQFVAVGQGGESLVSTNGTDWQITSSGTTQSLAGLTYGNGLFVAVGSGGTILTSADGTQWQPQKSPTSAPLRSVTFANGLFVAVGDAGTILLSIDGLNWTTKAYPKVLFSAVAFGNGKFVAVGTSIFLADLTPGILAESKFSANGFELDIAGEIGRVYRVQSSSTLNPAEWVDLGWITNRALTVRFRDPTAFARRYYRTISEP